MSEREPDWAEDAVHVLRVNGFFYKVHWDVQQEVDKKAAEIIRKHAPKQTATKCIDCERPLEHRERCSNCDERHFNDQWERRADELAKEQTRPVPPQPDIGLTMDQAERIERLPCYCSRHDHLDNCPLNPLYRKLEDARNPAGGKQP